MIDIHDYDIQCIEHEILWKYDKSPCDYPDCDCLLSLRKNLINERVLANQKEILTGVWKELMAPNFGVYTRLFVVKHLWLVYTMTNLLRIYFYRMMCINVLNIMIKTEVLKPVFTIIDKKVTFQSEREKVKSSIVEILNAPKSLVSIDINDARGLFQEGGEIHTYDASVGASMKKRMESLMDLIIVNTKKYEPLSHALVFFFFPKDQPLLMSELQPFSDWIESLPGDFLIKWGMATHSTHELRAIVLLQ